MWQPHIQQKARPLQTMTNQWTSLQDLVGRSLGNHVASKGPFGTAPAPDFKRGSGGAVPNEYFFKLILV
jgi:hypothetical protein